MNTLPKQSFKLIELPIRRFYTEALPHHKNVFECHKLTTHKLATAGDIEQLSKEVKDKKRMIKQLKDLIYELDTLRTQVLDEDLDRFDNDTIALRKIITSLIKDYNAIERQALILSDTENNINENIENNEALICDSPEQVQLHTNLAELKLQEDTNKLCDVIEIEHELADIHDMYVELNTMLEQQGEMVNQVEENAEATQENVSNGLKHIITAAKLKKATYPLTGALLGSLVGGPVGMVAGLKIGGAAAIGCGVVGYASGSFLNKNSDSEDVESDHSPAVKESTDGSCKKDK